ncbi:MAG TPA: TolC family protein [Bacteroidales bacterium]|nr:TolC family protein [Bacteroidales bacterium]
MNNLLNKTYRFLLLLFLALPLQAFSQNDSIDLATIIDSVVNHNPLILQSQEKVNSGVLREQLARSAYNPNIYTSASASRMFPVSAFDFTLPDPQSGEMVTKHFQFVPDIAMDYSLKLSQLIYDFGRTGNNAGLQQTMTEISRLGTDQLKQRLVLASAGYYYNLMYIQQALKIKTDQLNALNQHLDIIRKKQVTGSSTKYEILATQVRISTTQAQVADLESSRRILISHLNNLMNSRYNTLNVKNDVLAGKPEAISDSTFSLALENRPEMKLARETETAAEWGNRIAKSGSNPTLSFFGSTGYKNGYMGEINALKFNYSAGLSLMIPIFDNGRKKINTKLAGSAFTDSQLAAQNTGNQIRDEINESYASMQLAYTKIDQYAAQVAFAEEAYNHAKANYAAGAITNLDLLDASNALAESRLSMLRAQVDFKFYQLKFKSALGEMLY